MLVLLAVGGTAAQAQGSSGKAPKALPAPALMLAPIVGQPIPILPIAYVVADTGIPMPATRLAQLAWADSIIDDALEARGPEANWLVPADLRKVARRAPGMVTDPDHMSQAVMRFTSLKKVPDPLLANMRALVAMTNSRFVMIPAALRMSGRPGAVHIELMLVLADARSGAIAWRSSPVAEAATPAAAIAAAVAAILPDMH
ncbi:MAG TPA: hypothetical protein VGM77_01520 [Gemmatimonadales bacterium]